MFTLDHLVWVLIVLALMGLLFFLDHKFKFKFKTATWIIFGIYIAAEVFKILTHMFPASRWAASDFGGEYSALESVSGFSGDEAKYLLPKSLPFQLCSFMIFFVAYLVFGRDEKRKELIKSFIVVIFIVAGSLAVILATCLDSSNTAHFGDSFKDPQCGPIQYFTYHAGMIWYAIYLIKTKQVKMGFKPFLTNLCFLAVMFLVGIWANSILIVYEPNFMFLAAPPAKGLPILNLNHGWHVYMAHYTLIAVLAVFLFELPAMIVEWKKKKEA